MVSGSVQLLQIQPAVFLRGIARLLKLQHPALCAYNSRFLLQTLI